MKRKVRPDLLKYFYDHGYEAESETGEWIDFESILDSFGGDLEKALQYSGIHQWVEPFDSAMERGAGEFGAVFSVQGMAGYIGEEVDLMPYDTSRCASVSESVVSPLYDYQLAEAAPLQWAFIEAWLEPA